MDKAKSEKRKAKVGGSAGGSTFGRRAELAVLTALFVFANAVSALLVVRLGDEHAARVDVTATAEHRLAENTRRALARVAGAEGAIEIVIAAPFDDLDSRARVAVGDVLDEIQRQSEAVRVTRIDTGSGEGLGQFEALLARLRDRDRGAMESYLGAVEGAIGQLEALAGYFESDFPEAFGAIADALEGAEGELGQWGEHFRVNVRQSRAQALTLHDHVSNARALLDPASEALMPAADRAGALAADALSMLAPMLSQMAQSTAAAAREPGFPAAAQAEASAAAVELERLASASAQAADAVSRQTAPDIIRVARAIQGAQAALVIGPPDMGVAAIEFEAIFPPAPVIDSAGAGPSALRQRAEELISTTLLSLAEPIKPIVVFLHGEARSLLSTNIFQLARNRLGLRGIDTLEWAAVLDQAPPDLSALDPTGVRPIVYVVHNTDTLASASGPSGQQVTGPDRAMRLGAAIDRIVRAGEPLLLSLQRSTLPTFGDADPTAIVLEQFGLRARTGRPLLKEGPPGARRTVETEQVVRAGGDAEGTEGDVARALIGAVERLPTVFSWPVPLERIDPPQGARIRARPLYTISADDVWGEADWVGLARIPGEQRALVPNPPAPDSPRDDTDGPWHIAFAVEKRLEGGVGGVGGAVGERQRLVAVGSSGWFVSQIIGAATEVDGRRAPLFAGNGELLEASVLWLAGQDHLIARTPAAGSAPSIGAIGEGELRALQWGLIAGLPLVVLALGGLTRLIRR